MGRINVVMHASAQFNYGKLQMIEYRDPRI